MIFSDEIGQYYIITNKLNGSKMGYMEFFGTPNDPHYITVLDYLPDSIDLFIGKKLYDVHIRQQVKTRFNKRYILLDIDDGYMLIHRNALNEVLYDIR